MRRKLIPYGDLEAIQQESLSNAVHELVEAESIIENILGCGSLSLYCFNDDSVIYETEDGTYIQADFDLSDGQIQLDNIEEVAINEESHDQAMKQVLAGMVEALLEENEPKANTLFKKYLEMAAPKMRFMKGKKAKDEVAKSSCNMRSNMKKVGVNEEVNSSMVKIRKGPKDVKRSRRAHVGSRGGASQREGWRKRRQKTKSGVYDRFKQKLGGRLKAVQKKVAQHKRGGNKNVRVGTIHYDWTELVGNVIGYIDYVNAGPSLQETKITHNDHGDIVSISLPNSTLRNEAKLLSLKWDTLNVDVKVLREAAMRLAMDENFQKAVADVKRFNNVSANDELTGSIEKLVESFPSVLYLTQEELAHTIGQALRATSQKNFDDEICNFMAEGILRTAFAGYPERVSRIVSLANGTISEDEEDKYARFQSIVGQFYPAVEESIEAKMRVFEDLYDACLECRQLALANDDQLVREEASQWAEELEGVLKGEQKADLDLAEEVAEFLLTIVETNLEMQAWNIVKRPYRTTVGEHPDMAKKAMQSYAPSKDSSGDWGDPAPALDDEGGSYKSGGAAMMRNKSWGNKGGNDVYPSLMNPHTLKPYGDYKIKGEKDIDSDSALGNYQGKTWPNEVNPYIPNDVRVHVNDPNRVDDVENNVGLGMTSDLDQKISG